MECLDFLELRREVVEEVYCDIIHREQLFRMLAIEAIEKTTKRYGHMIAEIEVKLNFYRKESPPDGVKYLQGFKDKEYYLVVKCEVYKK